MRFPRWRNYEQLLMPPKMGDSIKLSATIKMKHEELTTEKGLTLIRTEGFSDCFFALSDYSKISGFTITDDLQKSCMVIAESYSGSIFIENCNFIGKNNDYSNLINIFDGEVFIKDCSFSNGNETAINISSSAYVMIENCVFSENKSGMVGGAINNSGNLIICDTEIKSNQSSLGGGIYNSGNLTLDNCILYGNTSTDDLGADIFSNGILSIIGIGSLSNNAEFYNELTGEKIDLPLELHEGDVKLICLTEEQAAEYFAPEPPNEPPVPDGDGNNEDTPPEQPHPPHPPQEPEDQNGDDTTNEERSPQEPVQPPEGEGADNPADTADNGEQVTPQEPAHPPKDDVDNNSTDDPEQPSEPSEEPIEPPENNNNPVDDVEQPDEPPQDKPIDTPPQNPEQSEESPKDDDTNNTTDNPADTTPDTPQEPADSDNSENDNHHIPPVEYRPLQRPIRPLMTAKPAADSNPQTQPDNDPVPVKPQLVCNGAVIDTSRTVVLLGYGDGLLHENDSLTRAQLATIIYRLLSDDSIALYSNARLSFNDVAADAWYASYVNVIQAAGIVNGVGAGRYNPNGTVTWAQIITILARFVEPREYTLQHIQYRGWAVQAIQTAVSLGWIEDNATFNPDAVIGRGELVQLINGVLASHR